MKNKFRTFFSLLCAVVLSFGLLACGKDKEDNKVYDPNVTYDEITSSLKLSRDPEGKTFMVDGIEKVTVDYISDGDTVGFILEGGKDGCRLRFHAVDTPESTIKVEKWGKAASLFTINALEGAEVIIESTTGGKPEKDSNGTRYLGYVWYRKNANEDYKNLNLQLVENGFAELDIAESNPYYDAFTKAYEFAKKALLHIHGFQDDPLFSTEAVQVTVKDLNNHIDDYYDEETSFGAKVTLKATVTDLHLASSGTYTWTIAQVIDGKTYSFPVFTGYASMQINNYLKIGNEYQIVGYVQKHAGKFQLSGLQYALAQQDPDYTKLSKSGAMILFETMDYDKKYGNNLRTDATVTAATLEGTTLKMTAEAKKIDVDGINEEVLTYTILVEVEEGFDANSVVGKTLRGNVYVKVKADLVYTANSLTEILKK